MGHCEKKAHMNMCQIVSCYRATAVYVYKQKIIANGDKEREITDCYFHCVCKLMFK
jgi:hypothetical protein